MKQEKTCEAQERECQSSRLRVLLCCVEFSFSPFCKKILDFSKNRKMPRTYRIFRVSHVELPFYWRFGKDNPLEDWTTYLVDAMFDAMFWNCWIVG
jgi:hypothetical protein